MYTTAQSTRRWNTIGPWIVILLFSLILFAIATTIVISLISLYLPTRNITPVSASTPTRSGTVQLGSGSNVQTGTLSSTTQTTLQNKLQTAAASNPKFGNNANVQVTGATGSTGGGKRKRRQQTTATEIDFTYILIVIESCRVKTNCKKEVIEAFVEVLVILKIIIVESQQTTAASGAGATTSGTPTTTIAAVSNESLVSDINLISEYWGNLRPYADNPANYFGVNNTGLPVGCQIEQAFILHRHAARYPTGADANDFTALSKRIYNASGGFTGPLTFLNTWTYLLGAEVLLTEGTYMETKSGLDFWDRYGRILYNASQGQRFYNITGTTNTPPLLRCNSISRVNDSAHAWANGFFALYNPQLEYTLLVMNATPAYNVTLASFISCKNFANSSNGIFDTNEGAYIPVGNYLGPAVTRLSQYMPSNFNFTVRDAYVFQSLCTYEYNVAAQSDFCSLFTLQEWKDFSYTLDLYVYNGYSFGSPFGRALGLGVLQELLARLQNQTITVSNSSVDTGLDGNTNTFPIGQQFYLDMSHDFMITGLMTAMSLDYFRSPLSYSAYPPNENRTWHTSHIIPYAARIITEKIGCASANPAEVKTQPTQYTPTQYGWSPSNAPNKFIRIKLNYGILPISTIRGGFCANRTDGLCPLSNFIASQANATAEANYGNICFGSFTYNASQFSGDGNYFF